VSCWLKTLRTLSCAARSGDCHFLRLGDFDASVTQILEIKLRGVVISIVKNSTSKPTHEQFQPDSINLSKKIHECNQLHWEQPLPMRRAFSLMSAPSMYLHLQRQDQDMHFDPICLLCSTFPCFALFCLDLLCFALLCFALLCFALLCFALLCFALLCFALLCFALL
jgi:hypothetical protein